MLPGRRRRLQHQMTRREAAMYASGCFAGRRRLRIERKWRCAAAVGGGRGCRRSGSLPAILVASSGRSPSPARPGVLPLLVVLLLHFIPLEVLGGMGACGGRGVRLRRRRGREMVSKVPDRRSRQLTGSPWPWTCPRKCAQFILLPSVSSSSPTTTCSRKCASQRLQCTGESTWSVSFSKFGVCGAVFGSRIPRILFHCWLCLASIENELLLDVWCRGIRRLMAVYLHMWLFSTYNDELLGSLSVGIIAYMLTRTCLFQFSLHLAYKKIVYL